MHIFQEPSKLFPDLPGCARSVNGFVLRDLPHDVEIVDSVLDLVVVGELEDGRPLGAGDV